MNKKRGKTMSKKYTSKRNTFRLGPVTFTIGRGRAKA